MGECAEDLINQEFQEFLDDDYDDYDYDCEDDE